MSTKLPLLVVLGASFALACGGSTASIDPPGATSSSSSSSSSSGNGGTTGSSTTTETETPPTIRLDVKASISSATLGDDCGDPGGPGAEDCAPMPDGGTCGGFTCQQSNLQLFFKTGAGNKSVRAEIISVTLHDAKDGALLDTLDAKAPRTWSNSGQYESWNEMLSPLSELRASYDLSAPAWSTIGYGSNTYTRHYRLRVTVKIDGVPRILESADLYRESTIPT